MNEDDGPDRGITRDAFDTTTFTPNVRCKVFWWSCGLTIVVLVVWSGVAYLTTRLPRRNSPFNPTLSIPNAHLFFRAYLGAEGIQVCSTD